MSMDSLLFLAVSIFFSLHFGERDELPQSLASVVPMASSKLSANGLLSKQDFAAEFRLLDTIESGEVLRGREANFVLTARGLNISGWEID